MAASYLLAVPMSSSGRSFKTAVAGGCQLCTMLRDLLPQHLLTTEWKYGIAEQEDFPPTILVSQLNRSSGPASDIVVPTYYPSRFYSREWCMGRYGQNGGLKLDNPTETTDFSLAYFRSDTSTGLLTVGPSQLALLEVQV